MKKHLDPLTLKYISSLQHENSLQEQLIKEYEKMVKVLDEENASLRRRIGQLTKDE